MHVARFRPDDLRHVREEGDDVVFDFRFDGVNAGDVKFGGVALAQMFLAASFGTMPSSAMASAACASISNQMRNLVSGDQIAIMSGRE